MNRIMITLAMLSCMICCVNESNFGDQYLTAEQAVKLNKLDMTDSKTAQDCILAAVQVSRYGYYDQEQCTLDQTVDALLNVKDSDTFSKRYLILKKIKHQLDNNIFPDYLKSNNE